MKQLAHGIILASSLIPLYSIRVEDPERLEQAERVRE